ncbi:MAG TPA: hypothetical protein VF062_28220 [Candidatus Limnocylindrales bacterium]
MTQPVPTSIPADGSVKVLWVPVIDDVTGPTLAELTDAAVIDLSCYLTDDGFAPAVDEQVSTDNRLCSRQTFERRGRFTYSLNLTYVYQGQDLEASDNEPFATLRPGELGYVVSRWGADFEDDIEIGDLVEVWPAECGEQMKQPPEANGRLRVMQRIFVRNSVAKDVAVAAS